MLQQLLLLSIIVLYNSTIYANDAVKTLHLQGDIIQGGLVLGKVTPKTKLQWNNTWINVLPSGYFLLGFGRNEPEQVIIKMYPPKGAVKRLALKVKQRQYATQRIDGLPKHKVIPKSADLQHIRKDIAAVKKARKYRTVYNAFLQGFIWPTKGRISGVYGSQRILNGKPKQPHYGVDIAVPEGTAVRAPTDGIITLADDNMFYSGGTIILDHGYGLSSSFLHLSKLLVKVGDKVKQGDVIAKVGATGRVTGAHLDWRMNWLSRRIDPQLLMQQNVWLKGIKNNSTTKG